MKFNIGSLKDRRNTIIFIILLIIVTVVPSFIVFNGKSENDNSNFYITNFAKMNSKVYRLDIKEKYNNMTGPFVKLSENQFLVSNQCGDVFISTLDRKVEYLSSVKIGRIKNVDCVEGFRIGMVKDFELFDEFILVSYIHKVENKYSLMLDKISRKDSVFDFENQINIFKSEPGTELKPGIHNHTFGRITKKNEEEIFLVIADYGAKQFLVSDGSTLGKIFDINISSGDSSLYASGFRSPGGLFYDQSNKLLWESDHGPTGGDEINLVKKDHHYGWPHVSYGRKKWKETAPEHRYGLHHDSYEKPSFVFVPSIGTSVLYQYPLNGEIIHWRGDLILGSLREESLYRLNVEGDKVAYSELLAHVRSRIRDIHIDDSGLIILKTDRQEIIFLSVDPNWIPDK